MAGRWAGAIGWRCASALLATVVSTAPVQATTVQRVEIEGGRVLIHFDAAVEQASSFVLDGPRRIAIDIDGARPGPSLPGEGAISAIRQGWRGNDGARVVLDLDRPMLVSGGGFEDQGRTLALILAPTDARHFTAAIDDRPLSFQPFGLGFQRAACRCRARRGRRIARWW